MRLTRTEAGVVLAELRRASENIFSPDESETLPEQVAVAALSAVCEMISHALAHRDEIADELVQLIMLAVQRDVADLDNELEDARKELMLAVLRKCCAS